MKSGLAVSSAGSAGPALRGLLGSGCAVTSPDPFNVLDLNSRSTPLVDWIADYLETVEKYPVRSHVKPGEISSQIADRAPEQGESM